MEALQRLTAGNLIEQLELLIGAEELKERRGRSLFYIRRKLRMNVQRLLLFCFLSALWDGHAGSLIYQRYSGDEMQYTWHFTSNASVWFLCRRECQGSDVLIRTNQNKSVSGRYSIEYQKTPPKGGHVTGFISSLETSDSGRYRIGVGRSLVPDEFKDFEIRVTGAEDPHNRINIRTGQEGRSININCRFYSSSSTKFFCRNNCSNGQILLRTTGDEAESDRYFIRFVQDPNKRSFTVKTTIFQLKLSDSGLYSCGLGESLTSASFLKFNILVTAATTVPTPSAPSAPSTPSTPSTSQSSGSPPFSPPPETFNQFSVLLVVGGSVVIGGMLAVVVLLLYKLKKKNQEIQNMECATYENLRGDPTYQSLNLNGNNQEQICSTLRTPEDTQTSC